MDNQTNNTSPENITLVNFTVLDNKINTLEHSLTILNDSFTDFSQKMMNLVIPITERNFAPPPLHNPQNDPPFVPQIERTLNNKSDMVKNIETLIPILYLKKNLDVGEWINQIKSVQKLCGYSDEVMFELSLMRLDKLPKTVIKLKIEGNIIKSLSDLLTEITKMSPNTKSETTIEDLMVTFMDRTFNPNSESIKKYCTEILYLLSTLYSNISELVKIKRLMKGLPIELQSQVANIKTALEFSKTLIQTFKKPKKKSTH
jgi:hypothetical protein